MIIQSDREAAERVCREVAELPDRSSPDDWPEAMLATTDELYEIVFAEIAAYRKTLLSDDRVEEVARAIVEATDGPWDWFSDLGQESARTQARDVLKTLRGEA